MLGGSFVALTGCAQQVGDIDRTQPNKIEKSIFTDGSEWYIRSTVVEVPGTAQSSFDGLQGDMQRVRWEVTEDFLVARRTHEDVIGIDSNQADPNEPWAGAPMAAFSIRNHFDIQRSYNAATGEQSNVIVENSSDRPWYERDYMRIDWSRNSAPIEQGFDPAVSIQSMSGLSLPPQDSGLTPDDITWRIEYDDKGNANYIDVLNTYVMEPSWIDCILTFGFPLYGGDCGPETIKVRTSFLKITDEIDGRHEPKLYDDHEMDQFGFFRTERCVYDRTYGCRDSTTVKLANTWRIWDNAYDSEGNVLPYEERTPKPIVYYYTANFPADLKDVSQVIADQWSTAYKNVAQHYHPDFEGEMFYLCENPGSPDDPGYAEGHCKDPGKLKELGDLRYSFFSWIDNEQQNGPLGYGPSSADPLTGEIINGNANIYGAAIDRYAQYVLDIVMLTNGDLDPDDFRNGQNVRDFIDARRDQGIYLGYNRKMDKLRAQSLRNTRERIDLKEGRIFDILDAQRGMPLTQRLDILKPHNNRQQEVWPKLRGTELERMMINDDIKVGFGRGQFGPNDPFDLEDPEVANMLSPAKVGTMPRIMHDYNDRLNRFTSRNMMMAEYFDPDYSGLSIEIKEIMDAVNEDLNGDGRVDRIDQIQAGRQIIRERLYRGVMEHEVGHTIGLRHNFEGSFDAVNFQKEYWDIRFIDYDMDGNVDPINPAAEHDPRTYAIQLGQDRELSGDDLLAFVDEIEAHIVERLRNQKAQKLSEYRLSSIMDYGAKLNADFHGIGLYDYAAIKYAYGDLVDVFNVTPTRLTVDYSNSSFDSVQPTNEPIVDWEDIDLVINAETPDEQSTYVDSPGDNLLDNDLDFYHYGVLPVLFGGMNGDMSNMYDRSTMTKDEAAASGKLRVPYRFCSDEYRGGTPSCDVWDQGASFEEIIDGHIQNYEDYYIFNNFRRDRAGWGLFLWPLFQRYLGRYFSPMANIYQHWTLRLFFNDTEWYLSEWGGLLGFSGIERGIGTMMNTLVSPNPGTYAFDPDEGTYINISSQPGYRFGANENTVGYTDFFDVPVGVGKYDFSQYDFDSGYYYYLRYEILTSFFERWAAMVALTNANTNFIGVDGASDITAFSIPVTLLYDDQLYRWFGALINGDMHEIGPVVVMDENEKMGIEPQNPLATALSRFQIRDRVKINPYSDGNEFNMPIFAMAYGLGMFQDRYDRSFNSSAAVYLTGRGETPDLPEDMNSIEWTDPSTGLTYMAIRSDFDADNGVYATGWNMIEKAIDLENKWRAITCTEGNDGELDCSNASNNAEYFAMQNHREQIDILVMTNRVFDNYNDTRWIIE